MDTDSIRVKIESVNTGLNTGLSQAASSVGNFTVGIKGQLDGLSTNADKNLGGLASKFAGMSSGIGSSLGGLSSSLGLAGGAMGAFALAAGAAIGAAMAKSVQSTIAMTTEAQKLGRALGIDATEASILALAIGDVYGSTDQYIGMVRGLNRQLKTNEEAMKAMGLQTRDSSGALKDQQTLVMDSLSILQQYKEGTDRNLAATTLFGRGVDVTSEMLALNAEKLEAARVKADDLNLALDQDGVAAVNAYRAAMNDAQDVVAGMEKAVGDALMPVLTELLQLFADWGPAAILIIRGAIGGLVATFHGLAFMVKSLWAIMKAFFQSIADYASSFADMWNAIFAGDFDAVIAARDQLWTKMKTNAGEAFDSISADARETSEKLANLFLDGPKVKGAEGGTKDYVAPPEAGKKDTSAADAKKALAERMRLLKEEFEAFKQEKALELEESRKTYADKLKIATDVLNKAKDLFGTESTEYRKAALEIVKIENERAKQVARIKAVEAEAAKNHTMQLIDLAELQADYEMQSNQISFQQRQAMQAEFEEQRYKTELDYLNSRIALMDKESEDYARALAEREALQIEHNIRLVAMANQVALDQKTPQLEMMQSIKQGMAETLASLLTGQMTLKQAFNAILKEMLVSFTKYLAQKIAASKIFAAAEIAINKAIAVILRVLGFQSAATSIASKSTETTAKIGQSAASAGAGAAESQASIPYIGPILAIAAMAAIFAAVMGMKGKAGGGGTTPSAEGGFDIPRGVNPLTQLHEQEMVLPKEQAEAIRNMSGEGGPAQHYHINAIDGDSVRKFFMDNKRYLAEAGKAAQRGGSF